jgi:hypothetical protein
VAVLVKVGETLKVGVSVELAVAVGVAVGLLWGGTGVPVGVGDTGAVEVADGLGSNTVTVNGWVHATGPKLSWPMAATVRT